MYDNQNQPSLSFGSLGSATTNGSQIGSFGSGMLDYSVGSQGNTGMSGSGSLTGPVVQTPQVPGVNGGVAPQGGGGTGWFGKDGKMNTIIGGVQVLGSLWNSYQQHKMAKEQMGFAREQWDTNLKNQTQTYNTALEDRIRARHFTEGKGAEATDAYIEKNSL